MCNLKHFVNVLTNHKKGSKYMVREVEGENRRSRIDKLVSMIQPNQYKPLLRKREVTMRMWDRYGDEC
jgi:hypothetical protein